MTYLFESLNDQDFQRLCQAILVTVFPNAQCLPVAQPDGGRDAFLKTSRFEKKDLIIFQVKYSRNPALREERDAVQLAIQSEKDKVKELISRGATAYYLLSNVSGTAHPGSGSIDKTNEALSNEFGIPSYCWWRDDLARRIDGDNSIKWSFPTIMRATDLLPELLNRDQVNYSLASDTLRAYMTFQYSRDSQVKFKQIELDRNIIDQFVDVPARVVVPDDMKARTSWIRQVGEDLAREVMIKGGGSTIYDIDMDDDLSPEPTGATELLASTSISHGFPRVVLEGAPGQGKSTVTQFLCQLHRMALLPREADLGRTEPEHRPAEARIPFRVDLRDYASWLNGRNPFAEATDARLPSGTAPVLETFLSAQVCRYTGHAFSTNDLVTIARQSQLLIVLDGFDEVADIPTRNKIVVEISDASDRLETLSKSVQIIVTSRPAAFVNSPGFSRDRWQHVQLLSLSMLDIEKYTAKWLDGREVDVRERRDIVESLREKLQQAHVRDLARNPMQLAILLALMSTQGASLPDKRTALYDKYIDVFFNREAEKSVVVRTHRESLIRVHRFLAYKLHSEAELERGAGSISERDLKISVADYLVANASNSAIVEDLFTGLKERVGALVSRVQGTFEFEVQPLREYFAARYLYDTAPYSPSGGERRGALPDRFEAVAQNPYWLNVTRFYSGCYSSGELASLVDGLEGLKSTGDFRLTSHVASLTVTLLSDYIFEHSSRLACRLAALVTQEPHLSILIAGQRGERSERDLGLPLGSGRKELLNAVTAKFDDKTTVDDALAYARVMIANSGVNERKTIWSKLPIRNKAPSQWLRVGGALGLIGSLSPVECQSLVAELGVGAITELLRYGKTDWDNHVKLAEKVIPEVLSGRSRIYYGSPIDEGTSPAIIRLTLLSTVFGSSFLADLAGPNEDEDPILSVLLRFGPYGHLSDFKEVQQALSTLAQDEAIPFADVFSRFLFSSKQQLRSNISIWSEMIEATRRSWGEKWAVVRLGITAVAVTKAASSNAVSLTDRAVPLCERLAYAKSGGASQSWWKGELRAAVARHEDASAVQTVVSTMLIWMTPSALFQLTNDLSVALDGLSEADWTALVTSQPMDQNGLEDPKSRGFRNIQAQLKGYLSPRLACLIVQVFDRNVEGVLFERFFSKYTGEDPHVIAAGLRIALRRCGRDEGRWRVALSWLQRAKMVGVSDFSFRGRVSPGVIERLPMPIAESILSDGGSYPLGVLSAAEKAIGRRLAVKPVGQLAVEQDWAFEG